MLRVWAAAWIAVLFFGGSLTVLAQQQPMPAGNAVVPTLVQFSGVLTDGNGKPLTGMEGVTFSLYQEQQGGAPLWLETQNVQPGATGHYTVMLGSTTSQGLPANLFVSAEARWLGIQVQGQAEQPRVMLLSVPYALKAGDAATVGGLPPSAFVLAAPTVTNGEESKAAPSGPESPAASSNVTTTGGTANRIPMFTTAANIQNSLLTQTGTAAVNVQGKLNLPAAGTASATGGKNSQPQDFVASAYNSTSKAAVPQTFQLQAEPADNGTAAASGTLNLLYASGTATLAETGLKISNKGLITFAKGQTFPGTGGGTITGVAAGTDLTGGGTSGKVTLNLDTRKVPQLNAANIFTGNQSINGNLSSSGSISGQSGTFTGNMTNVTVTGVNNSPSGSLNFGVVGTGSGTSGIGVAGGVSRATGNTVGVYGQSNSTSGLGVYGTATAATGTTFGVYGISYSSGGNGVYGSGATGVVGVSTSSPGTGGNFVGYSAPTGSGESGGVAIEAQGGNGDTDPNICLACLGGPGISAVGGTSGNEDGAGGVFQGGNLSSTGDGIDVSAGSGFAGSFFGNVFVSGTLGASTKEFKIDHPLDPANQYLVHASVESSEMMNIYTGNVTTDAQGEATVRLPEWFESLNTDFRYQLTVIGQFAQAIIGREIQSHQFQIRTNMPNVKVSWQVTGVRQDAFAKAHPLVVEEEKESRLRGFYIHPELYGAPPEKQIEWARHPQMMKRLREIGARQLASQQKLLTPVPPDRVPRPVPLPAPSQ